MFFVPYWSFKTGYHQKVLRNSLQDEETLEELNLLDEILVIT